MFLLELTVGIYFIYIIKHKRSDTWKKTKFETLAIIIGVLGSFALKIIIKITLVKNSEGLNFGKSEAVSYHVMSFIQFVLSEFLMISVWTYYKSTEDFFQAYNSLPIKKFSIFQVIKGKKAQDPRKMS